MHLLTSETPFAVQAIVADSADGEALDVELAASGFGKQHQEVTCPACHLLVPLMHGSASCRDTCIASSTLIFVHRPAHIRHVHRSKHVLPRDQQLPALHLMYCQSL